MAGGAVLMEMPRALAPWAASLELFPRELAVALWPLVQRLDVALGPLRARVLAGQGDPDGFEGIGRRGLYERLLPSEWLLLDEAPDEFARRAVAGEHAFLQLARRAPGGARVAAALFDAGPNQLGAPRLAHLAALIVLHRRAVAAGARVAWGVAQSPDAPLFGEVSEESVGHLLAARSPREAGAEDLETWRSRLGVTGTQDDYWLIGGRRLARLVGERHVS